MVTDEEFRKLREDVEYLKTTNIEILSITNKLLDNQKNIFNHLKAYILNTDSWVKQIKREQSELGELPSIANENAENIQHNYELIYELKDQIEELKQETDALKLIQIISLKQKIPNQQ